ncbi:uncharacterized protein LOC119725460 [Patiria miniata]|uniref:Ig-like domain-containing protein n=1 Tax=Patiria miniata TaxID=46514 RepID=A0A913ZP24_PATMI|nr:uncharacterized protein LOC119725460 [Patiria miniata]
MYWYDGSISSTSLLISNSKRTVAPQNGIPEGIYDIDSEFNLVIKNVAASDAGTYFFQVKPDLKMIAKGKVEVCDKVSPKLPYPTVIGCIQDIHDEGKCEVRARHDSKVHNLTCVMEQVKPAVELRWIRLFLGGLTELNASSTVRSVVLPPYTGSSLRNNTYSTSASVQVAAIDDNEVYACDALGGVVGRDARMIVRITKILPTTATYDEVQSDKPESTVVLVEIVSRLSRPPGLIAGLIVVTVAALIFAFISIRLGCERKNLNKTYKAERAPNTTDDESYPMKGENV